jgi:uncharacterized RDD family membrane protein YckC
MTDVVTGEAVALELPVANFPSRIAALLLDMLVQIVLLVVVFIVIVAASAAISSDYVAAEVVIAEVLVLVAYPTTFETLSRGKTLGKMALGIRVIGDDGSPVRFRQALVRALVGVFEIWTVLLAPVGLITAIVSARGKRVGDIFAGTYVIQERAPARQALPYMFAVVPPPLAGWAQTLQVARLSDQTAEAAGSYLRRFGELSPQARDALGVQLANAVAAQVSPPPPAGTPPAAYLAAVLAVRRAREQASFAAFQPAPPPFAPAPAASGPWPVAPGVSAPTEPAPTAPAPTAPAPGSYVPRAGQPVPPPSAPLPTAPPPAMPSPAVPPPAAPPPAAPPPAAPPTTAPPLAGPQPTEALSTEPPPAPTEATPPEPSQPLFAPPA